MYWSEIRDSFLPKAPGLPAKSFRRPLVSAISCHNHVKMSPKRDINPLGEVLPCARASKAPCVTVKNLQFKQSAGLVGTWSRGIHGIPGIHFHTREENDGTVVCRQSCAYMRKQKKKKETLAFTHNKPLPGPAHKRAIRK